MCNCAWWELPIVRLTAGGWKLAIWCPWYYVTNAPLWCVLCSITRPCLIFVLLYYKTAIWGQELLHCKGRKFATQPLVNLILFEKQIFHARSGKFYTWLIFLAQPEVVTLWQISDMHKIGSEQVAVSWLSDASVPRETSQPIPWWALWRWMFKWGNRDGVLHTFCGDYLKEITIYRMFLSEQ